VDALHSEGLDLDLVDQVKDLSVSATTTTTTTTTGNISEDRTSTSSETSVLTAAFSQSAPSTKVPHAFLYYYRRFTRPNWLHWKSAIAIDDPGVCRSVCRVASHNFTV